MYSISQVQALQGAYDYFNQHLFDGTLSPVIFNAVWSNKTHGYVAPDRWTDREGQTRIHELSMTPNTSSRPPIEVYSTLVHEMCHIWQIDHGTPSRNGYHNTEWADKMEEVGLMPSSTGQVGGKRTGQRMTHYIVEGRFKDLFEQMPQEFITPFIGIPPTERKKTSKKTKYTCPHGDSFWGKPGIIAECQVCGDQFQEQ